MLALIQADLFKTGKRPIAWLMLALSVMVVTAVMLTITYLLPANNRPEATNVFGGLLIGPRIIGQSLGSLLIIVLSASLIGIEYGYDTWKNLLIRHAGRVPFIISKWATLALMIVLGVGVLALWSLGLGLGIGIINSTAAGMSSSTALLGLVLQIVSFLVFGSVALMGAVIGRSTVAGIIVGFVWMVFDGVMGQLTVIPQALKGYLYGTTEASLLRHIEGGAAPFGLVQNSIVALTYLVLPVVIAALVFRQRDMAN